MTGAGGLGFDFGVMSVGDHRSMLVTLVNPNPIDVRTKMVLLSRRYLYSQILGSTDMFSIVITLCCVKDVV